MAKKAGFKNRGFLHNVISGRKNISKSSVYKLSQALRLSKTEAAYFDNLVFFNQAEDLNERNHFFNSLQSIRNRDKKSVQRKRMRQDQYEYYTTWYHSAIRSLLDLFEFSGDYQKLASRVFPPVTPKQARESVQLLTRLGLVQKTENGIYSVTEKHITTGDEIRNLAALNFHRECARLAGFAITTIPKNRRHITGTTLGISEEGYHRICSEINDFRKRIIAIVDNDEKCDRVYQMNVHLFPFSTPDTNEEKKP